ncbi:MAG: O-methyltransferase [Eubacterium sp.]|nr:O-methyltransferase [Eubacterium sp.]
MTDFSRINTFLEAFISDDKGEMQNIYLDAKERGIPVVRKNTKELLKLLILIAKPVKVLEVGTAVGYSALFMKGIIEENGFKPDIVTLELDEDRANEAEANFERYDKEGSIKLLRGDAYKLMQEMDSNEYGCFDMIFIDAAKAQYTNYMKEAVRLSRKGTIIVMDNIFLDGEIFESHFLVEKRDRTVHDKMRSFLDEIKSDERLETVILSVGDGMAVSVVK